ncbi:MAG: NAD(P)/FAD-dependent oxidoreductase [Clostridiaceae bacterium]|nr:NAD(P)/FAD-dependent oxidoreductase [Clostridiaceae bacterium]
MKIAVIGAGLTGLTAAYNLAKEGHSVDLFEREKFIGGLASAFKIGQENLDTFYHHIFVSDSDLLELSKEFNIHHKIKWYAPKNAIFLDNRLYPFTTPMDLLLFDPISLISRIRMGLLVLSSKFIKDYKSFENITARDWIIKRAGKQAYEKVWGPLLISKFDVDAENISGTWIWNKFKLRGSSRGKNISKELLGYMDGGFITLANVLSDKIKELSGQIHLSEPVNKLEQKTDGNWKLITPKGIYEYDKVLFTASPQLLESICHDFSVTYKKKLANLKYKSNICLILELHKPLSDYYWITVSQKDIPFVLIIEHTNLVGFKNYDSNIVYLSRYIDSEDSIYNMSDEMIAKKFVEGLKKVFPDFREEYIKRARLNKARFAQPVVTVNYQDKIPEIETSKSGLYLASMAQIHPEDRGLNYSIRLGKTASSLMLRGG